LLILAEIPDVDVPLEMASITQRSRTYGKNDFGKSEGQRCSIDIGKLRPEELKQVLYGQK
jgi:hypothetical protein